MHSDRRVPVYPAGSLILRELRPQIVPKTTLDRGNQKSYNLFKVIKNQKNYQLKGFKYGKQRTLHDKERRLNELARVFVCRFKGPPKGGFLFAQIVPYMKHNI